MRSKKKASALNETVNLDVDFKLSKVACFAVHETTPVTNKVTVGIITRWKVQYGVVKGRYKMKSHMAPMTIY